MRQKFVFVTAIAVCLSLTLIPAFAAERTEDRARTKASMANGAHGIEVEFSELTRSFPAGSRLSANTSSVANKAAALISAAAKQEGDVAVATLQQVIGMDLPSNAQTDKINSTAYQMLADLYDGKPSKQVVALGVALQYTSDAPARARIQSRIQELGGNAFDVQLNTTTTYNAQDAGADDTCAGAVAVALPHSETMNITPPGDHNWRSFDVTGTGAVVFLETVSDFPGSGSDDTDLGLWDACGGSLLAFNDDRGTDFTSVITSDCLAPGTYYVEVGGFFDSATPDNFDLNISVVEACVPPVPDSYEPDNDRAQAAEIGKPTHANGNGWGRVKKEIQSRSIIPAGDVDHATFHINKNELVRMGTAGQWPTFFNGFASTAPTDNPDTILTLLWENEPDYGGRCNQPDLNFLPGCQTDADCPDPLDNPLPGFPICIPMTQFGIPNPSPMAVNDDRGGGDFGSELLMCLPQTGGSGSPAGILQKNPGGYLVEVTPFSTSDSFDYELNVKNEVGCLFEVEPNNTFADATPYEVGTIVSGFFDFSVTNPYQDDDYYQFDVADGTSVAFQTFAPDPNQSDTYLELLVGPDDDGLFYFTGVSDEDGGTGFLSALAVTLPSASTLLGNTTADADYFMNVTSNYFNPNYYYDLASAEIAAGSAAAETEPNNDISSANTIEVGGTMIAEIVSGCDVDTFRFQLTDSTFIHLSALAGGDSAINLVECGGASEQLSCDDDSGGNMLPSITGCLPAGEYCAQVRAFSGADSFSYEIELQGVGGCEPTSPPTMSGDNSFTCLDFASCN